MGPDQAELVEWALERVPEPARRAAHRLGAPVSLLGLGVSVELPKRDGKRVWREHFPTLSWFWLEPPAAAVLHCLALGDRAGAIEEPFEARALGRWQRPSLVPRGGFVEVQGEQCTLFIGGEETAPMAVHRARPGTPLWLRVSQLAWRRDFTQAQDWSGQVRVIGSGLIHLEDVRFEMGPSPCPKPAGAWDWIGG